MPITRINRKRSLTKKIRRAIVNRKSKRRELVSNIRALSNGDCHDFAAECCNCCGCCRGPCTANLLAEKMDGTNGDGTNGEEECCLTSFIVPMVCSGCLVSGPCDCGLENSPCETFGGVCECETASRPPGGWIGFASFPNVCDFFFPHSFEAVFEITCQLIAGEEVHVFGGEMIIVDDEGVATGTPGGEICSVVVDNLAVAEGDCGPPLKYTFDVIFGCPFHCCTECTGNWTITFPFP